MENSLLRGIDALARSINLLIQQIAVQKKYVKNLERKKHLPGILPVLAAESQKLETMKKLLAVKRKEFGLAGQVVRVGDRIGKEQQ